MKTRQDKTSFDFKAEKLRRDRYVAGLLAVSFIAFVAFVVWAAHTGFDFLRLTGVCGFKQDYSLPCPTCGMTTAFLEFFSFHPVSALFTQPAGAVLCTLLVLFIPWALVFALTGRDIGFVRRIKFKYIILSLLAIFAGGWTVTIARTIAQWQ